jgi:hypothetical protein
VIVCHFLNAGRVLFFRTATAEEIGKQGAFMDEKKRPEETTDLPSPELAEPQLDKVVGGSGAEAGKIKVSEITITKTMDQASPSLFQQATGGSGSGTTTTTTTDTVVPES